MTAPEESEAAFSRHVLPEVEVMYRVARSMTRDHGEAEDLVQDTMLRAYRAIDRFDGRHPRAWLLTIMRNAHINRTRRRRPELMRDPDVVGELLAVDPDPAHDPEGSAMDRRFEAVVERSYRALPVVFREVINLVDLGGLSYQEAADVLGVPQGTVMSRLHRGRRRIRAELDGTEVAEGRRRR